MAHEHLRSIVVGRPPAFGSPRIDYWANEVTNAFHGLPFSLFSTNGGPNASNYTAPEGFIGIEIGSSATKHWVKATGSDGTGWRPLNIDPQVPSSGTWLPTLDNTTNVSASSAYVGQWMRVGNVVNASVRVDVDPTLTATATALGVALPVASNLASTVDCAGVAFASGIAAQGAAIRGDAANNRAEMAWVAADVTSQPMYCHFTYLVS